MVLSDNDLDQVDYDFTPRLCRHRGRVTRTLFTAHPNRSLRGQWCRWCCRQLQRLLLPRRHRRWGCIAAADTPPAGRDCVNATRLLLPARRTRSSNAESPRSCKPGSAPFQRSRRPTLVGAPGLTRMDSRKCCLDTGDVSARIRLAPPRRLLRLTAHHPSWMGAASTAFPTPTSSPPAAGLDAATDATGSTSPETAPCPGRRLLLQCRAVPPIASPSPSVSSG
jgi:hypothetical protein